MVSISYVQTWNLSKLFYIESSVFLRALPYNVPNTIISSHISVARGRLDGMIHTSFYRFLIFTESKEDRLDAGTLNICELCSVTLFLWEGVLVTLYEVVFIVLN